MLRAHGISKRYGGVIALAEVNFEVRFGEVVGLIGENGAGKSTLIKVLGGLVAPDSGRIEFEGRPVSLRSPQESISLGIGIIHQELSNLPNLDIASNIFLGREKTKGKWWLDDRASRAEAAKILARVGLDADPAKPLGALTLGEQQMVEIAKALSLEAKVLIMDEPTSSLSAKEAETLMGLVRRLREDGVGVVYVSHRLDEVVALADRVTALRDGRNAGELAKQEISQPAMIRLMVGRDLEPASARQVSFGEVQLRAERVVTNRFPNEATSLEVRAGEIVGIAGLVGSGRTELVNAIYGVEPRLSGEVTLGGHLLEANDPRSSIEAGLVLVPEDRRTQALILASSVGDNLVLPRWEDFARNGLVQSTAVREETQSLCATYGVKAASVDVKVGTLSGGNQQKVVLAKWLSMKPKCLIVDEPTRGIDVGAREEIYEAMRELAAQGVAILMVSSDLQEVLALSDRVIVMREGRMAGSLDRAMATEESVMELAVG